MLVCVPVCPWAPVPLSPPFSSPPGRRTAHSHLPRAACGVGASPEVLPSLGDQVPGMGQGPAGGDTGGAAEGPTGEEEVTGNELSNPPRFPFSNSLV